MKNMLINSLVRQFRRGLRRSSPVSHARPARLPVWNGNIDFSDSPSTSRPIVQHDAGYTLPAYAPYGRASSNVVSHAPRFRVI